MWSVRRHLDDEHHEDDNGRKNKAGPEVLGPGCAIARRIWVRLILRTLLVPANMAAPGMAVAWDNLESSGWHTRHCEQDIAWRPSGKIDCLPLWMLGYTGRGVEASSVRWDVVP